MPCIGDGCDQSWTWTAEEQIRSLGQPPPKRLCPACQNLGDTELPCVVETCKRAWIWPRDAQLKHRAWLKRQGEVAAPPQRKGRGKRRPESGAPRRKCEPCQAKWLLLQERVSVCKVHGCTREVALDKESQLRAWAALGTTDLEAEFPLPKRMCDVCREFCRNHGDRTVACARPGCEQTWTYKTGAQLQAFLAGRLEDPARFCPECSRAEVGHEIAGLGPNVEVMPCIVSACDGIWYWEPEMRIAPSRDGELPLDRMCNHHREAHGGAPRAVPMADEDLDGGGELGAHEGSESDAAESPPPADDTQSAEATPA